MSRLNAPAEPALWWMLGLLWLLLQPVVEGGLQWPLAYGWPFALAPVAWSATAVWRGKPRPEALT